MPKPKFKLKRKDTTPKDLPLLLHPKQPAVPDSVQAIKARWDYAQTQGGCNVCHLEPRWVLVIEVQGPSMGHQTRLCRHHAQQLFSQLLQYKDALEPKHYGG